MTKKTILYNIVPYLWNFYFPIRGMILSLEVSCELFDTYNELPVQSVKEFPKSSQIPV